jgi:hypothetical protein
MYLIEVVKGESLKSSLLAEKVIALDRKNMESTLKAVGREFPEDRRRATLFHPSNQMIIGKFREELVGYADFCDDQSDPSAIYLSSIQIETNHRNGMLFRILVSNLLNNIRQNDFRTIRTHIQKSNLHMIAIAKKLGFTLEENPKSPSTLTVFAERSLLDSQKLHRLFKLNRSRP